MSCSPVLCTFWRLSWMLEVQSVAALSNASLIQNIHRWYGMTGMFWLLAKQGTETEESELRGGGWELMLLPKQRENRREKMWPFIHWLSALRHLRTFFLNQEMYHFKRKRYEVFLKLKSDFFLPSYDLFPDVWFQDFSSGSKISISNGAILKI